MFRGDLTEWLPDVGQIWSHYGPTLGTLKTFLFLEIKTLAIKVKFWLIAKGWFLTHLWKGVLFRLLIVFIFVVIILVFIFDCIGVAWNTREKKFVDTFPPLSPIFFVIGISFGPSKVSRPRSQRRRNQYYIFLGKFCITKIYRLWGKTWKIGLVVKPAGWWLPRICIGIMTWWVMTPVWGLFGMLLLNIGRTVAVSLKPLSM